MTVGERIKTRRKELSMTVDELAELLEKNRATVYRYESDEIENMPITVLEPLSKALKTTPAYLMGWHDDSNEKIDTHELEISSQVPSKFVALFNMLNDLGKKEAIKRVEELTQIPRYQMHYVMAAHNDAEMTDEEIELMKKDLDEL